jgi:hypothetical protein
VAPPHIRTLIGALSLIFAIAIALANRRTTAC